MHKITTLKNGIQLLTSPMRGTKTATILVMAGTGSKYENKKISGLSHFLEHMFFKGTKNRPTTLDISSEIDSIGGVFNAFTGKEYTGYWIKTASKKMDIAMDVLSDMLLSSKFDSEEINREKGVIIEELNMYEDNPMMHIEDIFERVLYGDTSAGRDTIGSKENILNFKREDFVSYFVSQYSPSNITICVAGNINETEIIKKIEKYFSSKEFNERGKSFIEKKKVIEAQKKSRCLVEYKKTDQAHFSLGFRTVDYSSKEKTVLKLLSLILGGSMSSRLFINLRERKGLAYYVRTDAEVYSDCGYLSTLAGVPTDKVEEAIEIVLKEYDKIKNILVGDKELNMVKDMVAGRIAIQMEASDNLANWYSRQLVMSATVVRNNKDFKGDIEAPEKYLEKIKSITAQDVKNIANKVFNNENLNLAIIGPYKDSEKFEKILSL